MGPSLRCGWGECSDQGMVAGSVGGGESLWKQGVSEGQQGGGAVQGLPSQRPQVPAPPPPARALTWTAMWGRHPSPVAAVALFAAPSTAIWSYLCAATTEPATGPGSPAHAAPRHAARRALRVARTAQHGRSSPPHHPACRDWVCLRPSVLAPWDMHGSCPRPKDGWAGVSSG